jgi:hypothetical protein
VDLPTIRGLQRLPTVSLWAARESTSKPMSLISLDSKRSGERSAGNPPATFDEAGAGNVTMGAGLRPGLKGKETPPDPKVYAPALDPTAKEGNLDDLRDVALPLPPTTAAEEVQP